MTTKHSPAPWSVETVRNEGEYGSGPDTTTGFDSYAVLDANGRTLFDSLNSDVAEVHAVWHCLGVDAWDDVARENLTLAAAAPELLEALIDVLALYKWKRPHLGDALEPVIKAKAAIAKAKGEQQ
ncbi:hypothetical protein AADG64_09550 [Achromobacter xylosoxidans]|uniref:hypothetical protein n=1 Tax=Alcaligenes xylosoxydans xylosoxydans TaxID=85698 RepID=UPI00336A61CC